MVLLHDSEKEIGLKSAIEGAAPFNETDTLLIAEILL